jgi:hypothetical protein
MRYLHLRRFSMGRRSADFDTYIAAAAPFARPILEKIREAYHKADAEIVETMKWRMPHFEHDGIVGNMAAFKEHVTWGFWKASLMQENTAFREKVTDVSELPPEKKLIALIREAIALNESGAKVARAPRRELPPVETPDELSPR